MPKNRNPRNPLTVQNPPVPKDRNPQFRCLGMWISYRRLSVVVHNTQACTCNAFMCLFPLLQNSNTRVAKTSACIALYCRIQCGFRTVCGFREFRYLAHVAFEWISWTLWISIFRQTAKNHLDPFNRFVELRLVTDRQTEPQHIPLQHSIALAKMIGYFFVVQCETVGAYIVVRIMWRYL